MSGFHHNRNVSKNIRNLRNSKKGEPQNERYADNESKRSGEIENYFSSGRK